jgi:hypothetical protein
MFSRLYRLLPTFYNQVKDASPEMRQQVLLRACEFTFNALQPELVTALQEKAIVLLQKGGQSATKEFLKELGDEAQLFETNHLAALRRSIRDSSQRWWPRARVSLTLYLALSEPEKMWDEVIYEACLAFGDHNAFRTALLSSLVKLPEA